MDFQQKVIKCDEEEHFIFIKGKIHQEKFSILNIFAPNTIMPKIIKETSVMLKSTGWTEYHTIIVEEYNTPLSSMEIEKS